MGRFSIGGGGGGGGGPRVGMSKPTAGKFAGKVNRSTGVAGGGGWTGKAARGDYSGAAEDVQNNLGFGHRKQDELGEKYQESVDRQYGETQGVLHNMKYQDDKYLGDLSAQSSNYKTDRDSAIGKWQVKADELQQQAEGQASDARQTYTNDILPNMKGIMENAKGEASNAMTLAEAGDPNNKVQQAVRGMYEQQAQGVGRQGLADVGVLQAMGAQATAGQMANMGPMTGGQMQALMGANQTQAGMAMARAQQHMQNLRDQGISAGFRESDAQYQRGERARDRYAGSVQGLQNSQDQFYGQQQGFRNEIGGMNNQTMNVQTGRARDNFDMDNNFSQSEHQLRQGGNVRQIGAINDRYGGQQAGIAGQIANENAGQAQKVGVLGGIITGGATVAGAALGGPQGAMIGNAAGGAASQTMQSGAPNQAPVPPSGQPPGGGYGYYNSAYDQGPPAPYRQYSAGAYGGGRGPQAQGRTG